MRMARKKEDDRLVIRAVEVRMRRWRKNQELCTDALKTRIKKIGRTTKSWARYFAFLLTEFALAGD